MFTQYIASIRGIKRKHTSTVLAGFTFISSSSYIRVLKFIGREITRVESRTKLCWASGKGVFLLN